MKFKSVHKTIIFLYTEYPRTTKFIGHKIKMQKILSFNTVTIAKARMKVRKQFHLNCI
jgi:hypothetical protein